MSSRLTRFPCRLHPHLYEINTIVWLNELGRQANRTIRLGDVPDKEWDDLQSKGLDYVWLMGIWERSPESRAIAQTHPDLRKAYEKALPGWTSDDVAGSPYAIRSYRPDPELGTWEHLAIVRKKLQQRGLRLILDFVPNHTALDHPWIRSHPEYYIQGTPQNYADSPDAFFRIDVEGHARHLAHGKDPYYSPWTDTAQLNYFHEGTRAALLEELKTIAQHCDGVRCDMAMLVLHEVFQQTWSGLLGTVKPPAIEFWTHAISAMPDFVWISEVYWDREWELQQLGFHFTYDKRLYDRLCHSSPPEIISHLAADASFQGRLVRFLENHDEARCASTFGRTRLPAAATLLATLPGMRMYHQGQFEGKRVRIPVQLRRSQMEARDDEIGALYRRLLKISDEAVFHDGRWCLLSIQPAGDSSSGCLIGYQWRSAEALKLIVVNMEGVTAQGLIQLKETANSGKTSFVYCDQLTGQGYTANFTDVAQHGLYVRLEPFGAHIFSVST